MKHHNNNNNNSNNNNKVFKPKSKSKLAMVTERGKRTFSSIFPIFSASRQLFSLQLRYFTSINSTFSPINSDGRLGSHQNRYYSQCPFQHPKYEKRTIVRCMRCYQLEDHYTNQCTKPKQFKLGSDAHKRDTLGNTAPKKKNNASIVISLTAPYQ